MIDCSAVRTLEAVFASNELRDEQLAADQAHTEAQLSSIEKIGLATFISVARGTLKAHLRSKAEPRRPQYLVYV